MWEVWCSQQTYKRRHTMTERALVSELWMLLVCVSCLRILLTLGHYSAVADFVRSKPPGRKMVTRFSDNHVLFVCTHVCLAGHLRYQRFCVFLWGHREEKSNPSNIISFFIKFATDTSI